LAEQTSRGRLRLSALERLLLTNQFAILECLYPVLRHEFAAKRRILECEESELYDLVFHVSDRTSVQDPRLAQDVHDTPEPPATDRGGALTPW